jgi:N-acetylmuramoyl-L-alanine amidase
VVTLRRRLGWLCIVPALAGIAFAQAALDPIAKVEAAVSATPDYPAATWIPADLANYSYGNRPHDRQINLIVIHDIEGSYASAIAAFQDPARAGSAHYVIGAQGQIAQMVQEHDIAWHAGNWDYNTRSIGIEHEGYAWVPYTYTGPEYRASEQLVASICSRWGVPLDRNHVIGHNEVPDPNNPGLFGGSDHHTDPGPYWDWTNYMIQAQLYASQLPSPPHLGPDPVATNGVTSATVTWQLAQTCRKPITGYTVTAQPGNLVQNLPATATTATFSNLQVGTTYTLTVTALNPDGQDSLSANPVIPGRCSTARVSANPASPQPSGTTIQLSATSSGCANPTYEFWVDPPGTTTWTRVQSYSTSSTASWNSTGNPGGAYRFMVRARDAGSPGTNSDGLGTYDGSGTIWYTVNPKPCTSVTMSTSPPTSATAGATVTITGAASGCPSPQFAFWLRPAGSTVWQQLRGFASSPTFSWDSTGAAPGTVYFGVWAKDASSTGAVISSLGNYDVGTSSAYTLKGLSCGAVTLSAAPQTTATAGTQVTLSGSASGCPNPRYAFWMRPASSSTWQTVQGYSTNANFIWNTSGVLSGTYYFGVWARDASSTAANDAVASIPYSVTASCTSATLSSNPTSVVHGTGAHVTITAVAAGCTTSARYEFWMRTATTPWQLVQGYSTRATYDWNSAGAPTGPVYFGLWVKDASSSAQYDQLANTTVTVS